MISDAASCRTRAPSGLRGLRRLGHLVGWRLIEAGLLALARRRRRLGERWQVQCVGGVGSIEPSGNLQRRDAPGFLIGLRAVTDLGARTPEDMAATDEWQHQE